MSATSRCSSPAMAPTVVARDRPAGARLALRAAPSVIVMDDGFQNPSLRKDLAHRRGGRRRRGSATGCVIPAGPLRAPLSAQWALADALVVIGEGEAGAAVARDATARGKPVLRASLRPEADDRRAPARAARARLRRHRPAGKVLRDA